jgi:hypothetical protein
VLALLKEAGVVLHGLRGFACPTIIALCHPARNVTDDNLVSRDGGAEPGKTPGLADPATRASCIETATRSRKPGSSRTPEGAEKLTEKGAETGEHREQVNTANR